MSLNRTRPAAWASALAAACPIAADLARPHRIFQHAARLVS
jgi:hypothetical protein